MLTLSALAVIGVCGYYTGQYCLRQHRRNRLLNDTNWIGKYKVTYDRVGGLCSEGKAHYRIACRVETYVNDIITINNVLRKHCLHLHRLLDQPGRVCTYTIVVAGSAKAWKLALCSGSDEFYSMINDCKFDNILSTAKVESVHDFHNYITII